MKTRGRQLLGGKDAKQRPLPGILWPMILRDQQQVELRFNTGYENWPSRERYPAVFQEKEVVVQVALAAEPEVLHFDFGPIPTSRAYHPAVA